jgi:hypothetical protein
MRFKSENEWIQLLFFWISSIINNFTIEMRFKSENKWGLTLDFVLLKNEEV